MAGAILHAGATVLCQHMGEATPNQFGARVFVDGNPIVTVGSAYTISGCSFVPPAGNGPCASAQWVVGALRVLSQGQFVAITTGVGICLPTGTLLVPQTSQTRVVAE